MSQKLITVKAQISPDERAALEAIAEKETRSLSQVLRLAVKELLEKRANGR